MLYNLGSSSASGFGQDFTGHKKECRGLLHTHFFSYRSYREVLCFLVGFKLTGFVH